jgi:choice-of-anchor B domain-containing protein
MPAKHSTIILVAVCAVAALASLGVEAGRAEPVTSAGGTITLLGQIDPSTGGGLTSDVTGWVDPTTLKEYAFVGEWVGGKVFIVDVSDPANPSVVEWIPFVPGFDLKVWDHYLYLVDGNGTGQDGQIWNIADPAHPTFAGTFLSAHNIYIDDRGYMYNELTGLTIFALNPDPTDPTFVWSGGPEGHDALVQDDILYDFHGGAGTFIRDVTDPSSPVLLGSIGSEHGIVYHHSGVVSADGNYLYINDELAISPQPDIMVYDISDPANPALVDWYNDPQSTIHNTFRIGNYVFASYYVSGFKVFDISSPLQIQLVDSFDTSASSGELNFSGAWGCYPFTPSGNIYISDIENGLYIFSFTPDVVSAPVLGSPTALLAQNRPNPVRGRTRIEYELPLTAATEITLFDAAGRRVRTLVDRVQGAGPHSVSWDGRSATGQAVASGVYFYELRSGNMREARKMVVAR